jgi:hypothetical protein
MKAADALPTASAKQTKNTSFIIVETLLFEEKSYT